MSCLRVFSAFVLLVSCVGSAVGQSAPVSAPSEAVRTHVRADRFEIVTSIRGLPLGVRDALQTMWKSQTLDIAESDAEYQGTAASNRALPSRRLRTAGCSADHHCLVYYERGGRARTWIVALFQWTPEATRFEGGGTTSRGLKTLEDVRRAVATGALGPTDSW